ncbi:hypothetical protein EUX98_g8225 [Antrodiella citrinella]|uniref:FAD/NAD(P)-binding domain-containing protein n=1 Tax=Antrodiella citrinella TaxID=2447956 RepID=A0A4V3XGQ9_9APHY|nr:hypothetical protein EUX98_g8225 [Antrodiella citrinella]
MARYSVFIQHEMIYFSFFVFGKSSLIKAPLALYIKSQTPKEYWDKIIPTHPSGCKRFIIDVGYLKALNQENFTVNYDGVAEVTETGIRTKAGQFMEFDVIIEATGFVADEYPIEVSGIGGKTIQEY